jgi:hypothetical protein
MSDAAPVTVAKAVTAELAAASLSQEFEPERSYADWDLPLEDSDRLHVDVVIVTTEQKSKLDTRSGLNYLVPIDIAIRKRFSQGQQDDDTGRVNIDDIDALMLLTDEIHRLFIPRRLTTFAEAVWQETKILVAPERKHLRELRQFTGIVRVTFDASGNLA